MPRRSWDRRPAVVLLALLLLGGARNGVAQPDAVDFATADTAAADTAVPEAAVPEAARNLERVRGDLRRLDALSAELDLLLGGRLDGRIPPPPGGES